MLCVVGAGYLLFSLCGFFSMVSFSVVSFVLYLSVWISFYFRGMAYAEVEGKWYEFYC